MNPTLDEHVRNDPRILAVYMEARRRYREAARAHHNFTHVMRDLHRALVIAADESSVNYSILIPSVLLHDIGFCVPAFKKEGHDLAGAHLVAQMLPPLAYEDKEVSAIAHCVRAHKGHAEIPESLVVEAERSTVGPAIREIMEKGSILNRPFTGVTQRGRRIPVLADQDRLLA